MQRQVLHAIYIGLRCLAVLGVAGAEELRRGGTLRIAYEADITGMDPHTSLEWDFDQVVNLALPFIDIGARSHLLEAREGSLNQSNHRDFHVDELFDRWRRAVDVKQQNPIGWELQRYMADNMLMPIVTTRPTIQTARDSVKAYVYTRGMKVNFETTWLTP